jgi:hypothetical protein
MARGLAVTHGYRIIVSVCIRFAAESHSGSLEEGAGEEAIAPKGEQISFP